MTGLHDERAPRMAERLSKILEVVRERALALDMLVLLIAGVGYVYALFAMRGYGLDDSYITYTIAQNLADGHGFVFNPGARIQVTTTPLYTLFLTFFGLLGLDLPPVSVAFSAGFLWIDVALLLALGRRFGSPWTGRCAALLFMFHPLVLRTLGHETPLYMALVLGAALGYLHGAFRWVTVCAALAVLCRGDGILMAGLLLVCFVMEHRRVPWKELAIFSAIVAPWFGFAWIYFGSPLPSTLGAKISQFELVKGYPTFLESLYSHSLLPTPLTFLRLGLMGIGLFSVLDRKAVLLPLWAGLYVLGYWMLKVAGVFFWWYVPLIPVAVLLVGAGLDHGWRRLAQVAPPRWRWGVHGALFLAVLTAGYHQQRAHRDSYRRFLKPIVGKWAASSKLGSYRFIGDRWMKRCMRPRERLAMTEIGALGYYGRRPILDLLGLATPEVFPYLERSPGDNAAVIAHFRPEYYADFTWRRWIHQIRQAQPDPQVRRQGENAWQQHLASVELRRQVVAGYVFHRTFTFRCYPGPTVFQIWRRKDVAPLPGCGQ